MPTFDAGTIQADIEINKDKLRGSVNDSISELDRLATEGEQAGEQAGRRTGQGMGDALNFSLEGALDQAKDKVKSKLSDMAEGGAGAGKLVGAGVGLALVAGLAAAINMEGPRAKLTAQLDLTTTESARLGGVAGKLFAANYGEGLEDVTGAIRQVVQNIDGMRNASAEDLQGITGKVMSLASAFDQDLGGVTRAVGQMMRTGLAKDADEALDIIAKGMTSGVDKSEDFLETLNEYSTKFRDIGISGVEATGLISQGLKAGARDADTVADGLKEFAIVMTAGSEKTNSSLTAMGLNARQVTADVAAGGARARAAFDQVTDGLRAVEDPAKRAEYAFDTFGTKAEDLGLSLFALDLTTAAEDLGEVEGAASRVDAAMGSTAAGGITSLGRGLMVLADQLGQALLPILKPVIAGFAELLAAGGDLLSFVMDLPTQTWLLIAAITGLLVSSSVATAVSALGTSLLAAGTAAKVFLAGLGPVKLLLIAAAGAMAFYSAATDDSGDAVQAAADRWDRLRGTLDAVTGAVTEATRAQITQEAQTAGTLDLLEQAGISTKLYVDATAGVPGAQAALAAAVDSGSVSLLRQSDAYKSFRDVVPESVLSAQEFAAAMKSGDTADAHKAIDAYAQSIVDAGGDITAATDVQDRFSAAVGESSGPIQGLLGMLGLAKEDAHGFGSAADDAAQRARALGTDAAGAAGGVGDIGSAAATAVDPMEALGTATDDMGSAADAATTATQFLTAALDEQQGNAITAEQAQRLNEAAYRDMAKASRDLGDAQGEAYAAQSTLNGMIEAGTTSGAEYDKQVRAVEDAMTAASDAGDGLFDSQVKVRDSALAAAGAAAANDLATGNMAGAAAAANAVMEVQRAKFMASASAADIESGAAKRTADALFGIPGQVGTLIAEKGAAAVQGAAATTTQAVNDIPKNPTVTVGVQGGALTELQRIRSEINTLNGTVASVRVERNEVIYTTTTGRAFQADGGILAAANGLTLIGGRGISQARQGKGDGVTWAEGITNEEIYISMKSGMEARNRMFTDYAAGKLGGRVEWADKGGGQPAGRVATERRVQVGTVQIGRFDDADRFFDRAAWEVLG